VTSSLLYLPEPVESLRSTGVRTRGTTAGKILLHGIHVISVSGEGYCRVSFDQLDGVRARSDRHVPVECVEIRQQLYLTRFMHHMAWCI
jgi:hypothetical protein